MAIFQQAYDAAAERYADKFWNSMSAVEIAQAVYHEMRRLDAQDAATRDTIPAKRGSSSEPFQAEAHSGHTGDSGP
jgi:hypothetical protein